MLLRACNLAAQSPHLLVQEALNGDISRRDHVVLVESLGIVADRKLVLGPIETFIKGSDPLVVEAAIQALRLLYIRDTQPFPTSVRDALTEVAVSFSSLSVRFIAAACLADLSFLET